MATVRARTPMAADGSRRGQKRRVSRRVSASSGSEGPAVLRDIAVLQWSHQLGEIKRLVDLYQKVIGVDESRSRLVMN